MHLVLVVTYQFENFPLLLRLKISDQYSDHDMQRERYYIQEI